jgi:hypothetical protein
MFDLEQAIASWRQQMLAAGIKTPVPLEELESHLREEIEQQMKSGLAAQQAFDAAVQKIGQARPLKLEFKKAGEPVETRLVKLMSIACGGVAFLFSLWSLPFLFSREMDWTAKLFGLAAVVTTVLGWRYNHKFLPAIRNQLARTVIGFACCLGCMVWIQFFIINFVPVLMGHPESWGLPDGLLLAVFLWGWTVMAILGGVGHGLEKAAHRQTVVVDS